MHSKDMTPSYRIAYQFLMWEPNGVMWGEREDPNSRDLVNVLINGDLIPLEEFDPFTLATHTEKVWERLKVMFDTVALDYYDKDGAGWERCIARDLRWVRGLWNTNHENKVEAFGDTWREAICNVATKMMDRNA